MVVVFVHLKEGKYLVLKVLKVKKNPEKKVYTFLNKIANEKRGKYYILLLPFVLLFLIFLIAMVFISKCMLSVFWYILTY